MPRPGRDSDVKQRSYADGDNVKLAVISIVFTVFALSLGDAVIKQSSTTMALWQIFVVRSAIALPIVGLAIKARGRSASLVPQAVHWTALRSMMLAVMWIVYYAALPHVALAVAAAAYYTLPLFITLFAALLVGERVRPIGWIAVALGFGGVLLVLKPQADDFNPYALLPIASAILYALAMILTRTKCKAEHPLVLSLGLNLSFIVVGLVATVLLWIWAPVGPAAQANPFLLARWHPMGAAEWLAMGVLTAAVIIGSVGAAIAYQSGPSSLVATFDFSYVVFAALWGILFFAEVPDAITAAGMALIVGAGVLTVRR